MTSVDTLDASQRAVVQLVLKQGKSYGEIADLLGLEAGAVRARAHAALDALGPSTTGLTAGARADVADYLLGQQSDEDREATRESLATSPAARAWARSVAGELRPLAGGELPSIPAEAAVPTEAGANGRGAAAAPVADEEDDEGDDDGGEPLRAPGTGRSSRIGGIVLLAGVAVVVAVVVILLVSGSDDSATTTTAASSTPANTTASTPQQQTGTGAQGAQATPVAQINLRAADGSKAVGVAQVLSQGGQLTFAVVGQNLVPTSKNGAYAVWLYTSPTKSKLLGFVDPPVGTSGKFQNVIAVPSGANQYQQLIDTREAGQPKQPGHIVLAGKLQGVG
jgi:hypothetical protein